MATHFCMVLVFAICFTSPIIYADEVAIESTLPPTTVGNETVLTNNKSTVSNESSNKLAAISAPPPFQPPPPWSNNYNQHYAHENYHHHHQRPNHYYYQRPNHYHIDPIRLDQIANTSKVIVGEIVNGVSQAFQNLFSQPLFSRPIAGQLNGENIVARASSLFPSSARLLSQNGSHNNRILEGPNNIADVKKLENGNSTETIVSDRIVDSPSSSSSSSSATSPISPSNGPDTINYELEGQRLREEIVKKVGHLQTVLTTAMEVSKERRDIITRRILEQTNFRLERAKERADRILSEVYTHTHTHTLQWSMMDTSMPSNSQMVIKALHVINHGINGIHSFLHGIARINDSVSPKLADINLTEGDKINENGGNHSDGGKSSSENVDKQH
ncbi:hypothetical protein RDWZM_007535 [Blomia tropicalis]|uniref:Uncharacterized protein n=1 Tax=Blomia tropicalis TaxID=40697 RepID=A0A9Q0LXL6_BLOTA|nr:hypothetical protein RDWZM_007535 [Blomia tropicalis]